MNERDVLGVRRERTLYLRHVGADHGRHQHAHGSRALQAAFFLNLGFTLVEFIGGSLAQSLAVLSDAIHDLGDCLVLGGAWYLQGLAQRKRDQRFSYGYARFSVLGGWLSAGVLSVGAIWMLTQALPRFWHPGSPHPKGMVALAVFGLIMNGLAAWRLHGHGDLNQRSAYFHLLEDVLGWASVLVGGVVIWSTGWVAVDPMLSVLISLFILVNAWRNLKRGTGLLMQQQPESFDPARVEKELVSIPGVLGMHDLHTWSLDGNYDILTVHLVVNDLGPPVAVRIKAEARKRLKEHGIEHATIELEGTAEECELEQH